MPHSDQVMFFQALAVSFDELAPNVRLVKTTGDENANFTLLLLS